MKNDHAYHECEYIDKPSPCESDELDILADKEPSLADEMSSLSMLPPNQLEAGLHIILDDLQKWQKVNPLRALQETIRISLALNAELLKAHSPALLTAASERSFPIVGEKNQPVSKSEERLQAMVLKLQESSVRLSLANVRVRDEIKRRGEDFRDL
jgi:hypothetical protein